MSNIVPFNFEGSNVRIVARDGEPWFVLADVCRVLEVGNAPQAATRLDDDEKGIINSDTPGGRQNVTIINESGLYSLILTSRKPQAKRFKKWVTSEILPSIRKMGTYSTAPALPDLTDHVTVLRLVAQYANELIETGQRLVAAEQQVAEYAPKAAVMDHFVSTQGTYTVTNAAKALKLKTKEFTEWLMGRYVFRRQKGAPLEAYATSIDAGLLEVKMGARGDHNYSQVRITAKGLTRFAMEIQEAVMRPFASDDRGYGSYPGIATYA